MILYSIDADSVKPLVIRKGYRRLGVDETILPDDMFDNFDTFARIDNLPASVIPITDPTVKSIADKKIRSYYGKAWQILRKDPNGSHDAETRVKIMSDAELYELQREPYKGPAALGYAEITDHAEQQALMTALASGVTYSWNSPMCHYPRHGLHIESATAIINFSICFECQSVIVFGPDVRVSLLFDDSGDVAITRAPQPVFDAVLKRHGIPLSDKRPTP